MIFAFAFLAVSIHWNFEGGSLTRVEEPDPGHFLCHVNGERDQDGRNRQASWYSFRVDNAKGRKLTLDMVDLPGEYNYQPNRGAIVKETVPFLSDDGRVWRMAEDTDFDESVPRLRLRVQPRGDHLWVAHVPPYTGANLTALLRELKLKPESIGRTVEGRDIPLLTITYIAVTDSTKKVVWLMFRQHAWEAGSSWAGEGAIRYLASAEAGDLRRRFVFKIYPLCDPDGVARGGVRFNKFGYDLNRNWDLVDEKKMPEIAAQRRAILNWIDAGHRLDLLLTLHNTETNEYLDGPPDSSPPIQSLTDRLSDNLQQATTFSAARKPQAQAATTTEGKPGRMNVTQGLWQDRRIPAFLIEQRISRHPKLGRQPYPEDRKRFGMELVKAIAAALGV